MEPLMNEGKDGGGREPARMSVLVRGVPRALFNWLVSSYSHARANRREQGKMYGTPNRAP